MTQPNIVLIVVDQWRSDAFSHLGNPMAETPHMDTYANESTSFRRAYSSVPSCIAARAALMTGYGQKKHGRVGYKEQESWDYPHTLAGLLGEGGYHTHCVGKLHTYPARNLLGFHSVDLHDGYTHFGRKNEENYQRIDDYERWLKDELGSDRDIVETGLGCNGYASRPFCEPERYHPTNWVTTKAVDFLRRRDPTKPFFLNVSYHRPHPPFDPPKAYWDIFQEKPLPEVPVGDWAPEKVGMRFIDSPVPESPLLRDRARRAYYAQMAHIDNQINRITHALVEHEVWHDTIVVFVADHGDMMFDHNYIAKSLPYEGSAGIPFMIRLPQQAFGPTERTSQEVAELRDVLPTLCEAAGIDIPEDVDGKSLIAHCQGKGSSLRDYLHGEHVRGETSNHWIVTPTDKYVWYSQTGEEQYFDMKNDPQELHNAIEEHTDRVIELRQHLINELSDRQEGFVAEGKLVVGCDSRPILNTIPQKPADAKWPRA